MAASRLNSQTVSYNDWLLSFPLDLASLHDMWSCEQPFGCSLLAIIPLWYPTTPTLSLILYHPYTYSSQSTL